MLSLAGGVVLEGGAIKGGCHHMGFHEEGCREGSSSRRSTRELYAS